MRVDWENVRVRLNCAGRAQMPRGVAVMDHWGKDEIRTDHTLACYVRGKADVITRHGQAELRPGMCFWLRQGRAYDVRQDPDNPVGLTFIHFDLLDRAGSPLPADT